MLGRRSRCLRGLVVPFFLYKNYRTTLLTYSHPPSPCSFPTPASQLLAEFLDSHDAGEGSRCLRGLAVPFFLYNNYRTTLLTYSHPPSPCSFPTPASQLLAEFLDSHDAGEASRCLRGLAVPFFHHELVKQGLHAAMENAAQTDHIMTLFKRWVRVGVLMACGWVCG